jgi:hypothetical protein
MNIALMKYKTWLSHPAVKSIRESGLALSEIVKDPELLARKCLP